jgi:hypothetical protein
MRISHATGLEACRIRHITLTTGLKYCLRGATRRYTMEQTKLSASVPTNRKIALHAL